MAKEHKLGVQLNFKFQIVKSVQSNAICGSLSSVNNCSHALHNLNLKDKYIFLELFLFLQF